MAALTRGLFLRLVPVQIPSKTFFTHGISAVVTLQCPQIQPSLLATAVRNLRSSAFGTVDGVKMNYAKQKSRPAQETMEDVNESQVAVTQGVVNKVNTQIKTDTYGRLFAIIHMAGKQFRVTDGDLIMIEGFHPTLVGDVIRAEKVLLVGSKDFTLLGRPLLRPDLVRVEATVVEKSLTHTKTHFKKKRRKQYMRINFYRHPITIFRINCVRLEGMIDQRPEIEGVDGRVF